MSKFSDGEVVRRQLPAEVTTSGDGRTLDLRIVPYNTVARVSDNGGPVYNEMWMPGAFDRQLGAPNRVDVLMNFEHQPGIGGIVGRGTDLRSTQDALEGTFRMLSGPDSDKALELVNEGIVSGVSLEAIPLKSVVERGVVKRVKARLVNVALARMPAFQSAQVLAVREGDPAGDEELHPDEEAPPEEPVEIDPNQMPLEPEAPPEAPEEPNPLVTTPEPEPELQSEADAALERVGFEKLVRRAITNRAWDGSASRFTDEQYARSCLIDRGGDAPVKERCSLPVLEPNGDLNTNALGRAAAALAGARSALQGVTSAEKAAAARKLRRYYSMANMMPPASLMAMAAK